MIRSLLICAGLMALTACDPVTKPSQPLKTTSPKDGVRVSGQARAGISLSLRNAVDPLDVSRYDPFRR